MIVLQNFFFLPQQERFSPAQHGLILSYKWQRKKFIGLSGIAKGWSTKKLYMNKRDLNHTCSRRHSLSCCAKSPDTILSPGIILLWGLMVANCPIYQHKTVLCNLASLLLCIHQYIRSKKSPTESKPGRQCDLELTEGWSNGAAHWHAGDQDLACAASVCTARWAERHDRSSFKIQLDMLYR